MKKLLLFSFFTTLAVLAITLVTVIRDPEVDSRNAQGQTLASMTLEEVRQALNAVLEQVLAIQRALQRIIEADAQPSASPSGSPGVSPEITPTASPISSPAISLKPLPELILRYKIESDNTIIHEGDVESFATVVISDAEDYGMSHNICLSAKVKFYFTTNILLSGVEVSYDGKEVGSVKSEGTVGVQGTSITLPKNITGSCTYALPVSLKGVTNPLPPNASIKISVEPELFEGREGQYYPLYSTSKTSLNTIYFGQ